MQKNLNDVVLFAVFNCFKLRNESIHDVFYNSKFDVIHIVRLYILPYPFNDWAHIYSKLLVFMFNWNENTLCLSLCMECMLLILWFA